MNTSTQPPDGAGKARSKAAGELTLGLLSGEGRKAKSERCTPIPCGSGLAREAVDLAVAVAVAVAVGFGF
jgi:hypothetical protein